MAAFPEVSSIAMVSPVQVRIRTKTLISNYDDLGEEQRKQKWLYPRRDITVQYQNLSKTDAETLWEFYLARNGPYNAFTFFFPEPQADYPSYTGEYVGTADGSTDLFNLPAKTSSSYTVYLDGTAQAEDTDYTFSALGGTDGEDQINFGGVSPSNTPAAGGRITYDFTGVLKVRCRFAEDYMDFGLFQDALVNTGLPLRGLLNS